MQGGCGKFLVSKNKRCWDSVDTGVSKKQLSLEKENSAKMSQSKRKCSRTLKVVYSRQTAVVVKCKEILCSLKTKCAR
jgi:hypothetical protein